MAKGMISKVKQVIILAAWHFQRTAFAAKYKGPRQTHQCRLSNCGSGTAEPLKCEDKTSKQCTTCSLLATSPREVSHIGSLRILIISIEHSLLTRGAAATENGCLTARQWPEGAQGMSTMLLAQGKLPCKKSEGNMQGQIWPPTYVLGPSFGERFCSAELQEA